MKVIMVSKQFPKYHPKSGQPTHFVQKILHSLLPSGYKPITEIGNPAKYHTIRAGERWKVGEMASIRIWTGLPYRSKQEEICKVEIKKVWRFEIKKVRESIFTQYQAFVDGNRCDIDGKELIQNDGLSYDDFCDWFRLNNHKKDVHFSGQVICWNENINY